MILLDGLARVAAWDVAAFRFINNDLYWRPLADLVHVLAQDQVLLAVLAVGGLGYVFAAGWRAALAMAGWGAAAVVASNLAHNVALKPFFNRPRPFLSLADMHLMAPLNDLAGLSLSFPSTHAASAMALAIVVLGIDRRLVVPALGFAFLVGLGSIYSGGHYPLDVLAGYAVGGALGWGLESVRTLLAGLGKPRG